MRRPSLILFSIFFLALPTEAKVGIVYLTNLVAKADLIVMAKVESVVTPAVGSRYATARVSEIWKGQCDETIIYQVWPTFWCDTSTAKEGETVLLFLRRDLSGTYRIAHAGRGRFPLHTIEAKEYVRIRYDAILPEDLQKPLEGRAYDGMVETSTLREVVRKLIVPTE
jgi:hypothetical protein